MISDISAGLSGLNAAIKALDVSAETIVLGGANVPQRVAPSSLASGGGVTSGDDLARQVIDISIAGYSAQANLISIKVWDETMRRALNIIA